VPAKITTQTVRELKGRRPVTAVTAYDAGMGALASEAGLDVILVGDSLGNVVLGFETTVPVTLEMMVHHTAAVARARPDSLLVADLPFGWAHREPDSILTGCMRLMQEGGAEAVKLEGGRHVAPAIAKLVRAGVPVMGHIGLQPQQVRQLGRYRGFGKAGAERAALGEDARALEEAGVFAIVGEMIEPSLAEELTALLKVPLIGIGCGHACDGQILVAHDLLGLTPGKMPGFVRQYASLGEIIREAFARYRQDIIDKEFP